MSAAPASPRPLGVLGGMSWTSTAEYYRLLNTEYAARRGGLHSAPLLLRSVDFAPIAAQQKVGDWEGAGAALAEAVRALRERELYAAYAELGEAQATGREQYPDDNADGLEVA